ncbi:hypothetical protein C8P63_10780 [Melghirimyces profundicolus]|uniref:Uncharacterized protein n=1 Tax=Melghirimyces profundicolus TaxID=1242148 RepID=A0A2T6BYX8_9BACL|nr:hypothetical protein [Melghirimyces profundicolus]PTX61285.1 hypothetical protein C8P63_10780 [Melghirimyces profundicolus]
MDDVDEAGDGNDRDVYYLSLCLVLSFIPFSARFIVFFTAAFAGLHFAQELWYPSFFLFFMVGVLDFIQLLRDAVLLDLTEGVKQ